MKPKIIQILVSEGNKAWGTLDCIIGLGEDSMLYRWDVNNWVPF